MHNFIGFGPSLVRMNQKFGNDLRNPQRLLNDLTKFQEISSKLVHNSMEMALMQRNVSGMLKNV